MEKRKGKGFTLLEILLVIAAIGILASIVIVAINPLRQIGKAENAARLSGINTIQKALDQYYIANGSYPEGIIEGDYTEICETGDEPGGSTITNCEGKIDLRSLVPIYIAAIPSDPKGGGYRIAINPANNGVSLYADQAVLGETIEQNPIILTSGNRDVKFNTGTGFTGGVPYQTYIQPNDGKIIVVGVFASYKGDTANNIIRLNSDGSRDTSFNIGEGFSGGSVWTLNVQTDGKILVGGNFTAYQGVSANYIIRLNSDGSRDTSFNMGTGFNKEVLAIAIQDDGQILVGADFTEYNGVEVNRIIRLNSNGSIDTSFDIGTGFNSSVTSISIYQNKVIVGGNFTLYNDVSANRIVRLNSDGSRDSGFSISTAFNAGVRGMSINGTGQILLVGVFTTYQGVGANRIIRLNSDGSRDTNFNIGTGFDLSARSIILQSNGAIIIGGEFTTYQGAGANRIIRLNSDGSRDTNFDIGTGFNRGVLSASIQNDNQVILGGQFTTYQESKVNNIVRLDTNGVMDNSFDTGIGFSNIVYDITISSTDGKLKIGGGFVNYNGENANYMVGLNSDGSRDTGFNIGTGFNERVFRLEYQSDNKILVGGAFSLYNDQSANKIIRLNSDGSRDASFNIGTGFNSGAITSIDIQDDGKILLVGGTFSKYKGVDANRIIRLDSDGTRDTSFDMGTGFDNTVWDLSLQDNDNIVVVGNFTEYDGVNANRIIRLNSDGSIDTSFVMGTGFNNVVRDLEIQDNGKILVGGDFTEYDGVNANRIIRLNSDGSIDTSFNIGTGFNSFIFSIDIDTSDRIIIGGDFTEYQGTGANKIIRLNNNGTRDSSFNIGIGFNNRVFISKFDPEGNLVVGGAFNSYNGSQNKNLLVKLIK